MYLQNAVIGTIQRLQLTFKFKFVINQSGDADINGRKSLRYNEERVGTRWKISNTETEYQHFLCTNCVTRKQ